jgi:FkbM family methyltransferase
MKKYWQHFRYLFYYRKFTGYRHILPFIVRYITTSPEALCRIYLKDLGKAVYIRKNKLDLFSFTVNACFSKFIPFAISKEHLTIVDAGAFIGDTALYFRTLFPKAFILSVEPHPDNQKLFELNTGNEPNIQLLKGGIWHRPEDIVIANPLKRVDGFQALTSSYEKGPKCKGYTLPQIIEKLNVNFIDILKLDIEGAELALFTQGDIAWLNKVGLLIVEMHDHLFPGLREQLLPILLSKAEQHYKIREHDVFVINKSALTKS